MVITWKKTVCVDAYPEAVFFLGGVVGVPLKRGCRGGGVGSWRKYWKVEVNIGKLAKVGVSWGKWEAKSLYLCSGKMGVEG